MTINKLTVVLTMITALIMSGMISISFINTSSAQQNQIFTAILSPKEVVPPANSQAMGIAEFAIIGDTIKYSVNASNIHGATVSHIHMGTKGKNGLDMATLFDNKNPKDNVAEKGVLTKESGLFQELTDITTPMMDGDLYVDIHTVQNPNGEIRGQIMPSIIN